MFVTVMGSKNDEDNSREERAYGNEALRPCPEDSCHSRSGYADVQA